MGMWWVKSLMSFAIATHKPKGQDRTKEDNRPAPALAVAGTLPSYQSCIAVGITHPRSGSKEKNHRYAKATEKI